MLGNLKTANPKNLLPFILAIIPNIAIGIAAIKPTNNNFSISLFNLSYNMKLNYIIQPQEHKNSAPKRHATMLNKKNFRTLVRPYRAVLSRVIAYSKYAMVPICDVCLLVYKDDEIQTALICCRRLHHTRKYQMLCQCGVD